ncbi:MAG: hypothetical protein ABIE70_10520 [bacterium]
MKILDKPSLSGADPLAEHLSDETAKPSKDLALDTADPIGLTESNAYPMASKRDDKTKE